MRKYWFCIWIVSLLAIASAGQEIQNKGWDGQTEAKGMRFSWKLDTLGNLTGEISAPTQGWVSVGFNPKRVMKGANIIWGYVKDGKTVVEDEFGEGMFSHKPDKDLGGQSNVLNAEGSEKDGMTVIRFTIPLNSGDAYDCVLKKGEKAILMLAYGADGTDGLRKEHKKKQELKIVL